MKINKKYSYGGYDPLAPDVLKKKAELKELFAGIEAARIKLFDEIVILNDLLKQGKIDKQTYESRKKWFFEELKKIQIAYKAASEQVTEMKQGFKNKSLLNVPVAEFNHTEIIGSDFSQREPKTNVWNPQLTGVQFTNCNTINCVVNANCTIVGGVHKQIKEQNDGEYWVVDKDLKPVEPLHPKRYDRYNLSKDPKDLPSKPLLESVIVTAEKEYEKQERKSKIIDVANNPAELQKIIDSGELI